MNHILIEGFIGSGKGKVGAKLAEEMKIPLIDTDQKVSEKMNMPSEEIYDQFGEVYYRALETYVLSKLGRMRKRSIIVLGSGLPTMPQNEKYLKALGRIYYLKPGEDSIIANIEKNNENGWLEDDEDLKEKVSALLAEREPAYLNIADKVLKIGKKSMAAVVKEILNDVVKNDSMEKKEKLEK